MENKERPDVGSSAQLNHLGKESQLLQAKKYTKTNAKWNLYFIINWVYEIINGATFDKK